MELANEREAKRKIEMENASLKKEIDDLRALLHPFADDVDLKTSSVPVQTDQLVTPLAAIDEVIEKFSMIHREAQSHLSDGWDSEITLDSNVCDLVQHSLLELSRCKQSMQSLNEALVKTTDKSEFQYQISNAFISTWISYLAMTDSHSEETVNQEAKEFSSVAVNTEVEELDQLSPCESFSSVTSVPHETSNQLVAPSAPPADSMGFEWTESTTSTHVGFEGPKVVVPPIIKTPITSTDQSNVVFRNFIY